VKIRYLVIAVVVLVAVFILLVGTHPLDRSRTSAGKPAPHALDQSRH
jgi:hypothetical protein